MRKWIVLLLISIPAALFAQTHDVFLTWTLSTSPNVASQSVYRAPCLGTITNNVCSQEGSYTKIATPTATATSYHDTAVSALQKFVYYVTATCNTCAPAESNPSNKFAVTIPADPQPNPPSGLGITSVSLKTVKGTSYVTATWVDTPGLETSYQLSSKQKLLARGSGIYSLSWKGSKVNTVALTVCDIYQCLTTVR